MNNDLWEIGLENTYLSKAMTNSLFYKGFITILGVLVSVAAYLVLKE